MDKLPCGCQFDMIDDTFLFEPCSTECSIYKFVMEETKKAGKNHWILDLR